MKKKGIEKFITRKKEIVWRHAVRLKSAECEETTLKFMADKLVDRLGEYVWENGYDVKDLKAYVTKFDYGKTTGVAMTLNLLRTDETVHQFCYQFVCVAEQLQDRIDNFNKLPLWKRLFRFV